MRVTTDVFRERFYHLEEREGLTLADVAGRLGWEVEDKKTGAKKPDSSRVGRTLGIVDENGKKRDSINHANAVRLCRALHLDPVDVGI